jgi:hypothetical protein
MSAPQKLDGFKYETVEFEPVGQNTLRIKGTIALPEPARDLKPYLESVHRAVLSAGISEYNVDITGLTSIDASANRLFVDWVKWVMEAGSPYHLVFIMDRSRTWQRTALAALRSMAGDCVRIRP